LVTEQARGRKLGEKLMNALIDEARERGFNGITWQVLDWNEPAINFYKKFDTQFDGTWVNVKMEL
jgi:GNAT superfamily N-acetyltransferase